MEPSVRVDLRTVQPFWETVEAQDLNTRGWFNTRIDGLSIITRYNSTSYTINTVNVLLLNGIAGGTDSDDRQGQKIILNQLFMRFNSGMVCYVVYDRQANGANPTLTAAEGNTFFTQNDTGAAWPTPFHNIICPNYNSNNRLIWLARIPGVQTTDFTVDLQKLPTIYSGTDATIASIASGALYLVIPQSNTSTATTVQWQLSYFDA